MTTSVLYALDFIPSDIQREKWVQIAMALKSDGFDFDIFDTWSSTATNYNSKNAQAVWKSVHAGGVSVGTLFHLAKQYGYTPTRRSKVERNTHSVLKAQRQHQQTIDENNLSDYCLLHTKFIPHADVEHYYCAADLVVLPYKKIYQSGVLMMALSYGKPVLVSDLPPLKEVVADMQTAFLFESENSISLTKELNLILLNPEKLEQVRLNRKSLINTKYDWNEIGGQTKQAYQSLY